MKLILTALVLFSIAFGADTKKDSSSINDDNISHFEFANPESFEFGNSYYLDVDNDGIKDFQFTTIMASEAENIHTKYLVNALDNNEILSVDGEAAIAEDGNDIETLGNVTWTKDATDIIEKVYNGSTEEWSGIWSGDRAQYLGIKLVKNGHSYNGWVKVSVDPQNEIAYVDGYAINRTPNGAIKAGQI